MTPRPRQLVIPLESPPIHTRAAFVESSANAAADYDLTFVIHIEPRDIVNYANPGYYWRYDSAEVQQLISDARAATDQDEANDLLRRAARKISEDAASDWLALFADIVVAREGVSGYPANDASSRFDASRIVLDRN